MAAAQETATSDRISKSLRTWFQRARLGYGVYRG